MKILRELLAIMLSGAIAAGHQLERRRACPMYEPPYQEADQAPLTASDIENIVSPIALYPDQLIAQILGAATYPDQVTAASNYVNSSSLKDEALMKAVDKPALGPQREGADPVPDGAGPDGEEPGVDLGAWVTLRSTSKKTSWLRSRSCARKRRPRGT